MLLKHIEYEDFDKIEMDFNKKLLKKERNLLSFLIGQIRKNDNNWDLVFKEKDLIREGKNNNLDEFFEKLAKKYLIVKFYKNKELIIKLNLYLITTYIKYGDYWQITFNKAFIESLKRSSIFYKINLIDTIGLVNNKSFYIMPYLLGKKEVEVPLCHLKEIFRVKDKYSRFFDFEVEILEKVKEDFDKNGRFKLSYKKIKNKDDGRIIGAIRFFIDDKELERFDIELNKLIDYFKEKKIDFMPIMTLLEKRLLKFDYAKVEKEVKEIIEEKRRSLVPLLEIYKKITKNYKIERKKGRLLKEKSIVCRQQTDLTQGLYAFLTDVEKSKLGHILYSLSLLKLREDSNVKNDYFYIDLHYLGNDLYKIFIYETVKVEVDKN